MNGQSTARTMTHPNPNVINPQLPPEAPMLTYAETMALGQAQYQDVLDDLAAAGYPATFTQTGGMNAALEVMLEAGWALLITDAADALSWERADQRGWGVGLFAPEGRYLHAPGAFAETAATSTDSLLALIRQVLDSRAHEARG